mmetsp:Transcript_4173/g.14194  ORF Transcript_4173/g.14194 Transcript_4173/m.14194 type:complete len:228 (-) Transcript_4173:464-1147(-)
MRRALLLLPLIPARAFSSLARGRALDAPLLDAITAKLPLRFSATVHANLKPRPNPRRAAVLISLCNVHGEASLLYTLRTQHVGSHRGQVSFPGGHIDEGETAEDAAVRELREEVGFPGGVRLLGRFAAEVPAITGTLVSPVVGFLEGDHLDVGGLVLEEQEVEMAFTRSISSLLEPSSRIHEELGRGARIPAFVAGAHEPKIWGLTGWLTAQLLDEVVAPALREAEQ